MGKFFIQIRKIKNIAINIVSYYVLINKMIIKDIIMENGMYAK